MTKLSITAAMLALIAPGFCAGEQDSPAPTYSKEVSRILEAKCQLCHRPNDIAPFSLMTYDEAVNSAPDIRNAVSQNIMPPWKPKPGYGEFRDSYALSDSEKQTLIAWIDAGTPAGDPADLPPEKPVADSPWHLGEEPDLILKAPEYTPPRGADTYRCFSIPLENSAPLYTNAVQMLPGNKQIVHHVILFLDATGQSAALDEGEEGPGYSCYGGPGFGLLGRGAGAIDTEPLRSGHGSVLEAWAPGARTQRLESGIAMMIPANARIVMQMHYSPGGRVASDQSQIGLYFVPRETVSNRLVGSGLGNRTFVIPAGEAHYEVAAWRTPPPVTSGKLIRIFPHMHLLGSSIRVDLDLPDGTSRPLIYIDRWDFNWQGYYTFSQPVDMPGGSTLRLSCHFDNSADNPQNPSYPPIDVGWGEATTDEMCIAGISMILDRERVILGPLP